MTDPLPSPPRQVDNLQIISVHLLPDGVLATRCRGTIDGVPIEFELPGTYTVEQRDLLVSSMGPFSIYRELEPARMVCTNTTVHAPQCRCGITGNKLYSTEPRD